MQVYFAYDKQTGNIVHMHRVVNAAGQCSSCSNEDVLRLLPANIDPESVGVLATTMDQLPSARQLALRVDVESGKLVESAVRAD